MNFWQQLLRKLPRWSRRPVKIALFVCILGTVYWIFEKLLSDRHFETIVDSICSPITNTCFVITDAKGTDGGFYRQIFIKDIKDDVESQVRLSKPEDKLRLHDTRLWNVDHSWLPAEYLAWMLVGTFMTDAMAFQNLYSVQAFEFLFIGLGGGSLPSYVRLNMPKVHIAVVELDPVVKEMAEKWFEFKTDSQLKCLVGDGIDFLRTAASEGHKYDAIFLDACDNDQAAELSCPAQPFVEKNVIENAFAALRPMGVLTVNILTREEELVTKVANEFRQIFPTVISRSMRDVANTVLICLTYSLASFSESQQIFKQRFDRIKEELNLDLDYYT